MITLLINVAVFLSALSALTIHIMNKQSRSYLLILGYIAVCLVIVREIELSTINSPINYWSFPLIFLGIGEWMRFTHIENYFAEQLTILKPGKKKSHFTFDFFKFLPLDKALSANTNITAYTTSDTHILIEAQFTEAGNIEMVPDDFDTNIKVLSGKASVYYKSYRHSLTGNGVNAMVHNPFKIKGDKFAKIELTLHKRNLV